MGGGVGHVGAGDRDHGAGEGDSPSRVSVSCHTLHRIGRAPRAVTAVFAGDARYAAKRVASTAYAKVNVSTSVAKHYRTGKIGSTAYHYFRKNTEPVFTTTMSYYKGRKQWFQLQVYVQGKWYDTGSEYFALGTNGKSVVRLAAPRRAGIRARCARRTSTAPPATT